jgi:glycosyltransferase involved in cell wall biosynthesis
LDLRGLFPVHNGTNHAILGLVKAFSEIANRWSVSLLASEEGARFHDLGRTFGTWPICATMPDRRFTIALRPSQPWHILELVDLHRVSILTACLVLDTIAWDVAYCAPPHLEGVWQFLATHADGLLYDSEFTRRRFLTRFPAAANVPGTVTLFSFDPAEYVTGSAAGADSSAEGYILVVGNQLDHKDVRQTTRTLATAFPYRQIKVLGPSDVVSPFVSVYPSGTLSEGEIQRLYAGAGCVVFPSFYEGFGFPIVTALAAGRTVFVRGSELVDELAPFCHGRGRLVTFDRREELMALIGRLAEARLVEGLPIAAPEHASPRRWRNVAEDIERFLSSLVERRLPGRWLERERMVRQLISFARDPEELSKGG